MKFVNLSLMFVIVLLAGVTMASAALHEPPKYKFHADVDDSSMGRIFGFKNDVYDSGKVVKVAAIPEDGFDFIEWSDGDTNPRRTFRMNSDISITASFGKFHEISFAKNRFADDPIASPGIVVTKVREGEMPVIPEGFSCPENTDKYIYSCSWNKEIVAAEKEAGYILKVNRSIKSYTVTVDVDDETKGWVKGVKNSSRYAYGSTIMFSVHPNENSVFKKWSDGVTDMERRLVVVGDTTVIAIFEHPFKVNFVYKRVDGEKNDIMSGTVSKIFMLGEVPQAPEEFSCPKSNDEYSYRCHWNREFVAVDKEIAYTFTVEVLRIYSVSVMVDDDAHGVAEILNDGGRYAYGSKVNIEAKAKDGFVFDEWNDGVKSAKRTVQVDKDKAFVAYFKLPEKEPSESKDEALQASSGHEVNEPESSSSGEGPVASSSEEEQEPGSSAEEQGPGSPEEDREALQVASTLNDKELGSRATGKNLATLNERKNLEETTTVAAHVVPQFSVTTDARDIRVAGARVGSVYAVFDMQGRVILGGSVETENFNLTMPRAGTYMLRIGNGSRVVSVK